MRTFGDKPKAFQLEEGGELYYVGSEVYLEAEILALYVYAYFLLTDYRMRPPQALARPLELIGLVSKNKLIL